MEYQRQMRNVPIVTYFPNQPYVDQREFVNTTFIDFVKEYFPNVRIPNDRFRVPELTTEKSYEEFAKFFEEKQTKIHPKLYKLAQEIVKLRYAYYMKDAKMYDVSEIVEQKLEAASSPGFFYNKRYQQTCEMIEKEDIYRDVAIFQKKLLDKRPLPDLYVNALKWELRKVGKNPRTFLGGGKRMHILKASLFLHQNEIIQRHYRDLWIKVGMPAEYRGFHDLYEQLQMKGGKKPIYWDSDVSGWDRSVPKELLDAVFELRISWWPPALRTEDNVQRARVLYDLGTEGFVLLETGEVVQKIRGMASGDALTIFDNSLMHEIVAVYCLLKMIPWKHLVTLRLMEVFSLIYDACGMAFMGDDNLGACDQEKFPWFNPKILEEGYADFGFKMKKAEYGDKLEEREFLSRKFIKKKGIWIPKPDREKVLCQVVYGNKGLHPKEVFERCLALEKTAWPDEELYRVIAAYNVWYMKAFEQDLREEIEGMTSFPTLLSQFKSDAQLESLYCSVRA